jgi:alpha-galactosidase
VVYSLSNAAPLDKAEQWAKLSNMWRTTKDMRDTWDKLSAIGFSQDPWTPFAGPGHWNDPDMILPGKVGSGEIRDNALTVGERITQMTLWALLAAPLLISCHLTHLDDFTIRLLCNDEVLAVDQDPLGVQGRCRGETILTGADGQRIRHHCVYAKPLSDGRLAVGLFNRGEVGQEVSVKWSDWGLRGPLEVRNLWGQKDMGVFEDGLTMGVPAHGAQLITAMMSQTR